MRETRTPSAIPLTRAPLTKAPYEGTDDDVVIYKANANPDQQAPSHGPLPYLGIAVHSTTVMQPTASGSSARSPERG